MLARRHMHLYGTTRDAFAEIAISTRCNALNRPKAIQKKPLAKEDYFNARMIAEPLGLYDFCMETDDAVAVITTSLERARDLRQVPVPVIAAAHGGQRDWGQAFAWFGMPDEVFASSGHQPIAARLYRQARSDTRRHRRRAALRPLHPDGADAAQGLPGGAGHRRVGFVRSGRNPVHRDRRRAAVRVHRGGVVHGQLQRPGRGGLLLVPVVEGGQASQCGWLKDRFGVSWQTIPDRLPELLSDPGAARAAAATAAMLGMRKIVIADLEAAADGAVGVTG